MVSHPEIVLAAALREILKAPVLAAPKLTRYVRAKCPILQDGRRVTAGEGRLESCAR